MTDQSDIAAIAAQLADLTRVVEGMAQQLQRLLDEAVTQRTRSDAQQERSDLAERDLAEVSDHLQAAAKALRHSV